MQALWQGLIDSYTSECHFHIPYTHTYLFMEDCEDSDGLPNSGNLNCGAQSPTTLTYVSTASVPRPIMTSTTGCVKRPHLFSQSPNSGAEYKQKPIYHYLHVLESIFSQKIVTYLSKSPQLSKYTPGLVFP